MGIIQGQQFLKAQAAFLLKLIDIFNSTKIFKKSTMDKGITVTTDKAEDEIALPQLPDQNLCNAAGMIFQQLISKCFLKIAPNQADELILLNQVGCFLPASLHFHSDFTQDF